MISAKSGLPTAVATLARHSLKLKMSFLVKLSHKIFPLFNRFSTFDKNVNLSKANPEAENFFLAFPSLKYLDFYDVSKNSEHINTFEGLRLRRVTLPKSRSLTFQNKRKLTPKMEKFSNFFHNGERNLLPNSHGLLEPRPYLLV